MMVKRKILGINGSASQNSSNLAILKWIGKFGDSDLELKILEDLKELPHFQTELTDNDVPERINEFRNQIENSDGVIICTPEYVFSIPSGLKNAMEWCFSTTVFSDKPIGIITASASGEKGHEELKLIMATLQAQFTDETTLLIQGVKGKIDKDGSIKNPLTEMDMEKFVREFCRSIKKAVNNKEQKI
jgi:NAD(P)H-dependent FMN reductase